MSKAIAGIRLFFFALTSLLIVPLQAILLLFTRGPIAYKGPHLWHKMLCCVFGMKIRTVGKPLPTTSPVMFISNHISYLDILAMGSVLEASFVAKNDVAKWPVFGYLSTLQQTAFISRASKDALKERYSLQSYLKAGKSIIIFPEGTTNDGTYVLPFKSSLFSLALDHHLTDGRLLIQPFSIRVVPKPGKGGDAGARDYSWAFDDDTPMVTHLMRFAGGRGCIIEMVFHDPVDPKNYTDRKDLCRTVEYMVSQGHKMGTRQPVPSVLPEISPIQNQSNEQKDLV